MKTKRFLFFVILISSMGYGFSQNVVENGVYDKDELLAFLKQDINPIITREDRLSLILKRMEFAISVDGKYMTEIIAKTFKENSVEAHETYSYVPNNLYSVKKGDKGNVVFKAGFNQIFSNIDIKEIVLISLEVKMTRIPDANADEFSNMFSDVLNQAFTAFQVGDFISNILQVEPTPDNQPVSFVSNFSIPLDFQEYYELKEDKPMPVDKEDFGIAMIATEEVPENSSLFNYGKKLLNKGARLIYGQGVVETEKLNKISGIATIVFTKKDNSSIPPKLNNQLKKLVTSKKRINRENVNVKTLISETRNTTDAYFNQDLISERTYDAINMIIDLIEVDEIRRASNIKSFLTKQDTVITAFDEWITSTEISSTTWGFKKINVRNIYFSNVDSRGRTLSYNDAKVYFPYGLGPNFIVFCIKLQQNIHEYTAGYMSDNQSSKSEIRKFTDKNSGQ